MSPDTPQVAPSVVFHPDLGEGVVLGPGSAGFTRVFFRTVGERQVATVALAKPLSWPERMVRAPHAPTADAARSTRLALNAAMLPLSGSATRLSAAKVDLLPHQVVLVHRVAEARPRRFLVADEVGLGKTIQVALLIRELLSRGELKRALIVVPAGLVENWRRELNEVFNLDFEVFGADGDVTDRKSNAFGKHHRLIASIDTLKRPARVKRLLEAAPWDLVVFDEAQHLTAYKQGSKVVRTENFKLAVALRDHCRDLVLLSATPHQGDHFRFWQIVSLLQPGLFSDEKDLVANRHRLSAVVLRRTKADACDRDGGTLFTRRVVHTSSFTLNELERGFYESLCAYIRDGYDLARQLGGGGGGIGLVMTIFQKIASSSFAAVRSTLERRLLMLTVHEAIDCDERQDVDGREAAYGDARQMIAAMNGLGPGPMDRAQVDRLLADAKLAVLKKLRDDDIDLEAGEVGGATGEQTAAELVAVALPEERRRIRQLLVSCPAGMETKTAALLSAMSQLLAINPHEKAVVFTTYLGSVESIRMAITTNLPQVQVDVLKGGDHGAKTAAQKRFKAHSGPAVLICTAAGREGINLQFCRVLFNHDLPWNPMDLEQRIGRIHRYGQKDTAQVYNLVSADTIEGQVYQLLEEKLKNIAATLGKVDEKGEVAEDFRSQILGQLAEQIRYDELYRISLADPTLRRTKEELRVAMDNAVRARDVVGELFQDLERFSLDDYRGLDDGGEAMARLVAFCGLAATADGGSWEPVSATRYLRRRADASTAPFSTDRVEAMSENGLDLLGLEHPVVKAWLDRWNASPPEGRSLRGRHPLLPAGVYTAWRVEIQSSKGHTQTVFVQLGLTPDGGRQPALESADRVLTGLGPPTGPGLAGAERKRLIEDVAPKLLHRQLDYSGLLADGAHYNAEALAWVEVEGE